MQVWLDMVFGIILLTVEVGWRLSKEHTQFVEYTSSQYQDFEFNLSKGEKNLTFG